MRRNSSRSLGRLPPLGGVAVARRLSHDARGRSNIDRAPTYPASAMPTHQATAIIALLPIGVPRSSPRVVSMRGVKGWFSANQRTPAGIAWVGTKALLMKGRNWINSGLLLADSGVLETSPMRTASQVSANAIRTSRPVSAIQSRRPPVGPEPQEHRDPDQQGGADECLDHAADDVPGQQRGTRDRHRAEPVDDPPRHVNACLLYTS